LSRLANLDKRDASTAEAAGRVPAGRSVSFPVSQRGSQILGCRQVVRRYAYDGGARLFTDKLSGSAKTVRPGLVALLDCARPGDSVVLPASTDWFDPSISQQFSCSLRAIPRQVQQICAQYVANGRLLLFAGGGRGSHSDVTTRPPRPGPFEIGAHCPDMARSARSRLPRVSTHLARYWGSHTNSKMLVGMPFN